MINFLFVYFLVKQLVLISRLWQKPWSFLNTSKCCKFIYLQYMVKRKRCGHDRLV